METEVEMLRARLEEILNGLEQADPDDVGYDPLLIREMHTIIVICILMATTCQRCVRAANW